MNSTAEPTLDEVRAQVVEAAATADLTRLQRALRVLTHAPHQRGPHASVEQIVEWVAFARKEHSLTLQGLAERIGLKSPGPIGAAVRGRPLSVDRLSQWQAALKASKGRSTRRPGQRRTPAEKVAAGKARVARRRKKEQPVAAAPGGTVRHQPASHPVIQRANASKE